VKNTPILNSLLFLVLCTPVMATAQTAQEDAINHMLKLKFGSFVEQGHLGSIKKALKTYPQLYRLKRMGTEIPLLGEGLSRCAASWRCDTNVIEFLISKGLDINTNYSSFFPLEGAVTNHNKFYGRSGEQMRDAQNKTEAAVAKIEKIGGSTGILGSKKKNGVLSESRSFEKVQKIIALGADVNQIGATKIPLPYLVHSGNPKLLALLFEAGADVTLSLDYIDKKIAENEKIVAILEKYK